MSFVGKPIKTYCQFAVRLQTKGEMMSDENNAEFFVDGFHDSGGIRRYAIYRKDRLQHPILSTVDWTLANKVACYLNKVYNENRHIVT